MQDGHNRKDVLEDGALTVAEAEAFSGLGRTTLYAAMARGELAHTRVGRRRLIPKRALVELLSRELVGGET